jgi:hypothetical protein
MARSYVDSILDAAAMASRQDTLGDMLNQLPGILVEQERYRDQQQKEAERYNDEKTFRNTQYNDMVESRKYQEDTAMVSILADLEGDEAIAFGDTISYKTEKGGNLGESVRKAKLVSVANNNEVNTKIRELSTSLAGEPGKEPLTYAEAQQQYDELELFLSEKGIKRDLNPLKKQVAVKQGREFGMNILNIVDFPNEDELKSLIQTSNNPTEIVTFMVDRIDKQKLDAIENKKDKDELLIDLGNAVSALRNSGASESLIKRYEDKITMLSTPTEDGGTMKADGLMDQSEIELFTSQGKSGIIIVPNNDTNRTEKSLRVNLDTGEYTYTDDEIPVRDINQELKIKEEELESAKNNPNITQEEYKNLREEVNNLKEESDKPKPLTPGQQVEKEIQGEEFRKRASRSGSFFF